MEKGVMVFLRKKAIFSSRKRALFMISKQFSAQQTGKREPNWLSPILFCSKISFEKEKREKSESAPFLIRLI